MKIAYMSPFSPSKSGISDFSEELVLELKKHMDIDLFYEEVPDNPDIFWSFECYPIEELDQDEVRESYDLLVYELGNNILYHKKIMHYILKYPGVIELHDYCLANAMILFCGSKENVLKCVKYCDGQASYEKMLKYYNHQLPPLWETSPMEIAMNKIFLEHALGIIVHSFNNKLKVERQVPNTPVEVIQHHTFDLVGNPVQCKINARKTLSLPSDKLIFGSFGYASKDKRIIPVLRALKRYKDNTGNTDFLYYIVGSIVPNYPIIEYITKAGLEDNVIITGFVDIDQFKLYLQACDFCINLRYPSHGETSGSLQRMFGFGKCAIVTDIDSFSDYPNDFAFKIPYGDEEDEALYNILSDLLSGKKDYVSAGEKALYYAKVNFNLAENAKKYYKFFESVILNQNFKYELLNTASEVGLNGKYLEHLNSLFRN